MFVGESGVMRIVQRTCEVMKDLGTDDPAKIRAAGAIDLPTLQKYINFHFSVSVDLFGQELSSNGAGYFTTGLKGRYHETKIEDDHKLADATYPVLTPKNDAIVAVDHPALVAINERLRQDYIDDCERGLKRWNKVIAAAGVSVTLSLPHRGFNRRIGLFGSDDVRVSPDGRLVTEAEWNRHHWAWLPTDEDRSFVATLMRRVVEPGKIAGWIAPPPRGINGQPFDYEYVRFN